jgi:hypothetical protein
MKREARGAASVPVRLWVYKCNALNLPHQVAWGDWDEVFSGKRPTEWGGSQTMRSTASLHILWEEMTPGEELPICLHGWCR